MSNDVKLVAQPRTLIGSANSRRLRKKGLVPGNVYGHKQENTAITVKADDLAPILKAKAKVVDLEIDGKHEKAVIREVQKHALEDYIIHLDLMRVDPNERVNITVPLELKGTAPGALSGGVLEQPMHSLAIDCLAYQIPDSIIVRIGSLDIGQAIHVNQLELPEGCHPHAAPDAIVVHVIKVQEKEITPTAVGPAEPEVVGKKPAEGDAAAKDEKKDDKKKK